MAEKKKEKTVEAQTLAIELTYPETVIGRYANHVVVQSGPQEINLLFFEIRPPMLMGTSEEVHEQAQNLSSVKAECVSRVIIPVSIVPNLLGALTNVAGRMMAPAIRATAAGQDLKNKAKTE